MGHLIQIAVYLGDESNRVSLILDVVHFRSDILRGGAAVFGINLVWFITLPPRVSKTLENPSGNRWYVESSQGTLQRLSYFQRPWGTARHSHSGQFGAEAV